MKVFLEIDERYTGVLSITAVATAGLETRVSTTAVDLTKNNHFSLGADGKWAIEGRAEDGR